MSPRSRELAWLALPAVSLVLVATHFFRGDAIVVAAGLVGLIALLAVRRWWAARLVQLVLLLATAEWLMTLLHLAFWRAAAGAPIVRLVVILGAVAVFTAGSALVFRTARLRVRYGLRPRR